MSRGPRRAALAAAALLAPIAALGATALPASAAVARPFSCTGTISRVSTKQTVNGTLTGKVPTDVSVLDYTDTVLLTTPTPLKRNGWWGGYWKTSYAMNQWALGAAAGNSYHLMLPDTRIGGTFQALLVTEFGPRGVNGNWQNWMDCTAV